MSRPDFFLPGQEMLYHIFLRRNKIRDGPLNLSTFITGPILGVSTSRKDYALSYFQANKKDYGVEASNPHAEDFKKKCPRKESS